MHIAPLPFGKFAPFDFMKAKKTPLEESFLNSDDDRDYLLQDLNIEMEEIYPDGNFHESHEPVPRSTILDAAFNFTNSIVGAGIIGIGT